MASPPKPWERNGAGAAGTGKLRLLHLCLDFNATNNSTSHHTSTNSHRDRRIRSTRIERIDGTLFNNQLIQHLIRYTTRTSATRIISGKREPERLGIQPNGSKLIQLRLL